MSIKSRFLVAFCLLSSMTLAYTDKAAALLIIKDF